MTLKESRKIILSMADDMPSDVCADWIDALSVATENIDKVLQLDSDFDKIKEEILNISDNPLFNMVSREIILDVVTEIIDRYKEKYKER